MEKGGGSALLMIAKSPKAPPTYHPPHTEIKISLKNLWLAQLFFRQTASTSNSTHCQEYDVSQIFDKLNATHIEVCILHVRPFDNLIHCNLILSWMMTHVFLLHLPQIMSLYPYTHKKNCSCQIIPQNFPRSKIT